MAATIWDTTVRASIADRAQRVTADAKPGWGKMNASAMMAHINDSLRMALGDLSYDEYGALIAKHTDHHLRQFGV